MRLKIGKEWGMVGEKAKKPKAEGEKPFHQKVFSFSLSAFRLNSRFLLAQAMETTQTPDNICRIDADNFSAREARL